MTFSCKKFSCWAQSSTLSAAVLYTFNMTNVSCHCDIKRSSFTCLLENDSSVWMWIEISFYRILRPRETPLVRHSEPLVLKRINDVSFIFVYSLSRCLSGGFVPIAGSLRKSPAYKDFQKLISSVESSLFLDSLCKDKSLSAIFVSLQTVLRLMAADNFQLTNGETCAGWVHRSNLLSVLGCDFFPFPSDEWTSPLSAPDFYQQIFGICISFVSGAAQPMKMVPANCRFSRIDQSALCPSERRRGLGDNTVKRRARGFFFFSCFALTLLKAFNFFKCSSYVDPIH